MQIHQHEHNHVAPNRRKLSMYSPKLFTKAMLQYFGYQMRRTPRATSARTAPLHLDPFYDQHFLLGGARGGVVLDVGAHVGQSAQTYKRWFPDAVVHCFEPWPESYAELTKTASRLKSVSTHNCAVADRVGTRRFSGNPVSATNSLFAASGNFSQHAMRDGHTVKWIDVPTTTLDRFTDEKAISEVDVLKMDIQGAELLALEGSKRLLAGQHIQLIYAEVSFTDLYEGQCLFHELSARLTSYRYKLFGLYNFEYAPVPSYGLLQADALFFSPEVESALRDPSSG